VNQPAAASGPSLRGVLLDGRYRLDQVRDGHDLSDGRTVTLWRAVDVGLDRRVAVVVATTRSKKARRALAVAATRASRVSDGRCVRVLDVGDLELDGQPGWWVASEWVEGPSLAALLRRAPLPPEVAVDVVRECAEALAAAARDGCHHGHLHPEEVLIAPGGLPRITGLETAAALAEQSADEADDVRGLGALLFAAVTARWPLPEWKGLPGPERGDGTHPRSMRGDVPRELDDVTARALTGGYGDLDGLVRDLRRLPSRAIDAPAPPPVSATHAAAIRRWSWRLVPPLLVAVIAAGGWIVGSDLGRVPESARTHHAALPTTPTAAPGTGRVVLVWRSPPAVSSFDPEGDGEEDPDAVGFAVDHDPSTTWTTDRYRTAHFGGLKSGVGLLVDLGRPKTVRVAQLALQGSGADVELRAGDRAPHTAADLPLATSTSRAGATLTWNLRTPTTARYWLIWFTNLAKVPGGYRAGITDLALLGPAAD
jgi:hypothetical protein